MLHQKETEKCLYSRTEMKQLRLSEKTVGLGWGNPVPQHPLILAQEL